MTQSKRLQADPAQLDALLAAAYRGGDRPGPIDPHALPPLTEAECRALQLPPSCRDNVVPGRDHLGTWAHSGAGVTDWGPMLEENMGIQARNGAASAHLPPQLVGPLPAPRRAEDLLGWSNGDLAGVDPVLMNLLVAKGIPSLADLDIPRFQGLADGWAEAVRERLPNAERVFCQTPWQWKNDVNFFRLGVLCGFLEHEAGIAYKEEQRNLTAVWYTEPTDLFLNGVMDTRRGTCGNMAALHVAIGWRLGWPVSLACVKSHFVCRYDDGKVTHNIEATQAGYGGFKSDPDDYLIREHGLPEVALSSGSDLRALRPREVLGVFFGLRGRHMRDTGRRWEAEVDYLLARCLFPNNRRLYIDAMALAVPRGAALFESGELGSPQSLAVALAEQYGSSAGTAVGHS